MVPNTPRTVVSNATMNTIMILNMLRWWSSMLA